MTLSARSRPRARAAAAAVLGQARLPSVSALREWLAAGWQWQWQSRSTSRHAARSRALPGAVRLALERGERVLAVGRDPDGGHGLVLTDRAAYCRAHLAGADGWSRLGWEQIATVGWDTAAGRLVLTALSGVVPHRTAVQLQRRGSIPELARERVTHTTLGRWRLSVAGSQHAPRHVVVEARRRPVTGEVRWLVLSGAEPHDDSSAELAIARLAAHLGLTYWSGSVASPPVTGRHRSGDTEAAAE